MIQYKEGQEVCLSIEQLQHELGNKLTFCKIVSNVYAGEYDLYNEDEELACMNGEVCSIEQIGTSLITFANYNGEGTIHFTLAKEEAEVALFGNS